MCNFTKNIMRVVISTILISFFVLMRAQTITLDEKTEKMSVGKVNCLVFNIPYASKDDIVEDWKDLMKKAKAKVSGKDEIFADNASFPEISANTIDFYFRLEKDKDDMYTAIVALDLGGAFLNSKDHPEGYAAAKKMLLSFAKDLASEALKNQIKNQESKISKLNDNIKDLEKENRKLQKEIENCESTIKENKEKISSNEKEIQKINDQFNKEKEILEGLNKNLNKIK